MKTALMKQLEFIERGGRTLRMHTIPTVHPQNVAAHSFGVAWLCWLLADRCPSTNLIMAALQHDIAEHVTGDIPAPTKRALNICTEVGAMEAYLINDAEVGEFALTSAEARVLKLADAVELVQHCVRERSLGNRSKQLIEMYATATKYAKEVCATEKEYTVLAIIESNWMEAIV